MHRRLALEHMLRGLAAGSLLGPAALFAQQPNAVVPGAAQPGALGQRPPVVMAISDECRQMLRLWEKYSKGVTYLHGAFDRYVYDSTFLVERRAVGEIWYEHPDSGRIDLFPSKNLPEPNAAGQRLNPKKTGANGQPYAVQADSTSRWICRGDALLSIDVDQGTYIVGEIPPHMQGQNIIKSPLPFIFGVSAQAMEERYHLSLGSMHDVQKKPPVVHVVASPRRQEDAKEWSRAEVILDAGTTFKDAQGQPLFVPRYVRLFDPTGAHETVYAFKMAETKVNERRWIGDPFRDPGLFSGYKCAGRYRVACEDDPQRTVETPAAQPQTR